MRYLTLTLLALSALVFQAHAEDMPLITGSQQAAPLPLDVPLPDVRTRPSPSAKEKACKKCKSSSKASKTSKATTKGSKASGKSTDKAKPKAKTAKVVSKKKRK